MICDAGDIVLVPFPFVDLPRVKTRPALVISAQGFNEANQQSLLVMITTASNSHWPSDLTIHDLPQTGLAHPSIIRWKIFTLPNSQFLKRLGRLGSKDMAALRKSLRTIVQLG